MSDPEQQVTPPAPIREVRYEVSKEFVPILAEAGVSLLVSTYQAGKLVVVGTDQGKLTLSFHNFEQAMGLALSEEALAVGTRNQVWMLAREMEMAGRIGQSSKFQVSSSKLRKEGAHRSTQTIDPHPDPLPEGEGEGRGQGTGPYDDCYLARRSEFTGQIHVHEMAWGGQSSKLEVPSSKLGKESLSSSHVNSNALNPHPNPLPEGEGTVGPSSSLLPSNDLIPHGECELWVVNTLFSCLATLDGRHSFVPRWKPGFISALGAEDRCHLNGLAMWEGKPKYVTAMAQTDVPQGWRPTKVTSGCVIDVESGETIARGLAMPHSPRLAGGRLWVLNSGLGNISYVEPETGRIEAVEPVPGYTRGLAFHGPLAFVGMSRIRETSTFGGVPIAEKREELRCGVAVVDMRRGTAVAYIEFKSGVEEIFAVEVVPHAKCPFISGPTPTDDDAEAVWVVPGEGRYSGGSTRGVQGSGFSREGDRGQGTGDRKNSHLSQLLLTPKTAEEWNEYGGRLTEEGRYEEAAAAYRRAIEMKATCGAAWANLAFLTADRGETEAGRQLYAEAYRHQPSPQLRIVQATVLPPIFRDAEHLREARRRFEEEVERLVRDGVQMDAARTTTPSYFFLAYQGYNDRGTMEQLAQLAPGREMVQGPKSKVQSPKREADNPHPNPLPKGEGTRIRLGILSEYLCDHTIGKLNVGLIEELDKRRFEVVVLRTGTREDEITRRIRKAADKVVAVPHEMGAALKVVAREELDVLHYPDIGMAPFTYGISHSRLAPVQTVTWGHPVTSGLSTIDYFLSCEQGETKEADGHYTEKLVRLPRLNVCLERPQRSGPPRMRGHFGLADDAQVYACPQMLFKFHPDFDAALTGILRGDERAIVVTLDAKYPEWRQMLEERWRRVMPEVAERIRFLPKMPRGDFLELLACSDVMLDPFPFGGGHTSFEALALGLPVVTLPGEFLRGRLTHAMYRQMGYGELIAASVDKYVLMALKLGTDERERKKASAAILESCGVLFEDRAIVREMEEFWAGTARGE